MSEATDIMCSGHRFVKTTLLQSPGYLADLSPYINAVLSSRLFATPMQLTSSAIKPLAPLAQSILPARAASFILSGTLTCEYCLHQVSQDSFNDGSRCPALLLQRLSMADNEFVLADQLIEAQRQLTLNNSNLKHTSDCSNNQSLTSRDTTISSNDQVPGTSSASTPSSSRARTTKEDHSSSSKSENSRSSDGAAENSELKRLQCEPNFYKNTLLIMEICPEIGLHAQSFVCIDCSKEINLNTARLCHYDGRYYCQSCHTGSDMLPIPARVLRNWDFTPKPVSKSSLQKICFLRTKPVLFNLFEVNVKLYGFIDRLFEVKHTRQRIQSMLKYLNVCRQPDRPYLVSVPEHFLRDDLIDFFTLNDLFDINHVYDLLSQLQTTLETHIVRKCESCRGKGFYCELCKDPCDILYPFSKTSASCPKCQTVFHANCFLRKKKNCPRCLRLKTKRDSSSLQTGTTTSESNAADRLEPQLGANSEVQDCSTE